MTASPAHLRAAGASKRARLGRVVVGPRAKPASGVHLVQSPSALAHRRRHVIDEELFRGSLLRERKRSDRSNVPFLVLLLELDDRADSSLQGSAVDALLAAKRETDVLGWVAQGTALGVIIAEAGASDPAVAAGLEARVRHELVRRVGAETIAGLSIRFHVHAGPMDANGAGRGPVDPLLRTLHGRDLRSRIYGALKRAFDIAGSFALLILLAPLLAAIAAVVKCTSRGPVLFRQERVGEGAKSFPMLKFRTMDAGADHRIHGDYVSQFIKSSAAAGGTEIFKMTNDPRVTSVGRVLRKTSLDELPQLWNVLRGEMSLVGPRPPLAYEVEQYKAWHRRRVLEAKPGITGLWQVKGRSRTTFEEMVRLDLRYARKRSLWMDVRILLATPSAVITGRGAC
jgi:lipopolysaccharide/colanic/teichoic acid biosynthesis glycosyltransferase